MNYKQQGWALGLELILDEFGSAVGHQSDRAERQRAAAQMQQRVERKCRGMPPDYRESVDLVIGPFLKTLRFERIKRDDVYGEMSAFYVALPEAQKQARDDGLEIVLEIFGPIVAGEGPRGSSWTWSEIADDLKKKVEYEVSRRSRGYCPTSDRAAYRRAILSVVGPFREMLQGKHPRRPLADTPRRSSFDT